MQTDSLEAQLATANNQNKEYKDFILRKFQEEKGSLSNYPFFRNDKAIVMEHLETCQLPQDEYRFVPYDLQNDREVLRAALTGCLYNRTYNTEINMAECLFQTDPASALWQDKENMIRLFCDFPSLWRSLVLVWKKKLWVAGCDDFLTPHVIDTILDPDVVSNANGSDLLEYHFIGAHNEEFCIWYFSNPESKSNFGAAAEYHNDWEIVIEIVKNNPDALQFASDDVRRNRDIHEEFPDNPHLLSTTAGELTKPARRR
jgi:hypothetical protein